MRAFYETDFGPRPKYANTAKGFESRFLTFPSGGTVNPVMGDAFDAAKTEAVPGDTSGTWPAGMKHFVWAKGETVVQFHGDGPW
jgi:hypothetical protein